MKSYRIEKEHEIMAKTGIEFFHYQMRQDHTVVLAHIHPAVEILFLLRGSFLITTDDSSVSAEAGSVVLFRSNSVHCIRSLSGGDADYYVLKIKPTLIMELSEPTYRDVYLRCLALNAKANKCVWTKKEADECGLHKALEYLLTESESQLPGTDIAMKIGTASVLLALLRDLLRGLPSEEERELPGNDIIRRIYDVTFFVHSHYSENLTAADCASMAFMSYSYFSRMFLRITGKSFKEYLNLTRIHYAEKALLAGKKSVTEIASDCGFNNVSYFISVYKKLKGVTPHTIRNGQKQSVDSL